MNSENSDKKTGEEKIEDSENLDDNGDNPSNHKKVISPINDLSTKGPDLNALLEKDKKEGKIEPAKPPTNSIVPPGGEAGASISDSGAMVSNPGSTITPHGDNPSNISI